MLAVDNKWSEALGYAVDPAILSNTEQQALCRAFAELDLSARGGSRLGLLHPEVLRLVSHPGIRDLVEEVLGSGASAVRATMFDKTATANWLVPWHHDDVIPVREKVETPGFEAWSVKEGVTFVRPPVSLMESILALRIHLDDAPVDGGALRVIAGSHQAGRLDAKAIEDTVARERTVHCPVAAGGVMRMRPLLLHASSRAAMASHRRVVHLEFSADELPNELEWRWRVPVR